MARYAAFGFQLECDFELPELMPATASAAPTWRVERQSAPPTTREFVSLGTDTVYGDVHVQASTFGDTFRLMFDDTGTFDVILADRRIAWYPGVNTPAPAVRADLLGRVVALAAHADGAFALHASAVSIDGEAIAFLGPKYAGKSTLALALVCAGARLLTDDTLVVRMDENGVAWASPGVHRVRLWEDSARALSVSLQDDAGNKPAIEALPASRLELGDVRLGACYVIHAGESASHVEPISRTRMPQVAAAMSCVRFSKLGALASGRETGVVLDRAARLTTAVPVFDASVSRDLARLEQIAASIMAWHRGAREPVVLAAS